MRRQLEQVCEYAQMGHVTVQVVPYDAGAYPGQNGPFVHMEFQDPGDDDVLYIEQSPDMVVRDDPELVGGFLETFLSISDDNALSPDESLALIRTVIGSMKVDDNSVG